MVHFNTHLHPLTGSSANGRTTHMADDKREWSKPNFNSGTQFDPISRWGSTNLFSGSCFISWQCLVRTPRPLLSNVRFRKPQPSEKGCLRIVTQGSFLKGVLVCFCEHLTAVGVRNWVRGYALYIFWNFLFVIYAYILNRCLYFWKPRGNRTVGRHVLLYYERLVWITGKMRWHCTVRIVERRTYWTSEWEGHILFWLTVRMGTRTVLWCVLKFTREVYGIGVIFKDAVSIEGCMFGYG